MHNNTRIREERERKVLSPPHCLLWWRHFFRVCYAPREGKKERIWWQMKAMRGALSLAWFSSASGAQMGLAGAAAASKQERIGRKHYDPWLLPPLLLPPLIYVCQPRQNTLGEKAPYNMFFLSLSLFLERYVLLGNYEQMAAALNPTLRMSFRSVIVKSWRTFENSPFLRERERERERKQDKKQRQGYKFKTKGAVVYRSSFFFAKRLLLLLLLLSPKNEQE